jgi:hypothetical protein
MGQGQSKNEIDRNAEEKLYEENLLKQQLKQMKQQREILERYSKDLPTSNNQIKWMAEIIEKYKECPKKNIKVHGKYDIQGNFIN